MTIHFKRGFKSILFFVQVDPAAQEANLNTTYRKRTYQQDIQADQRDQAAQVDPEDREDQADPADHVSQIRVHQSKLRLRLRLRLRLSLSLSLSLSQGKAK